MEQRRIAIEGLDRNARVIAQLVSGLSIDQARWKPEPEAWSVLEVICHLLDEEREDFRLRLALLLEDPGRPWPAIDPESWPRSRNYLERDLGTTLRSFLDERNASLAWLGGLRGVDWQRSYPHPRAGPIRAGDLLCAWAAHDLLHLRQLARIHYRYLEQAVAPFALTYAGGW